MQDFFLFKFDLVLIKVSILYLRREKRNGVLYMKRGIKGKILFISGIISCMALFTSCSINSSNNNNTNTESIISTKEDNTTIESNALTDDSITVTTNDTELSETNENVGTEDETDSSTNNNDNSLDNEEENQAYTATFVVDSNVKVLVYDTQDMSGEGTLTTTAIAKDSALGTILTDGNGQVNFKVVANDGYYIDNTCISITGTYKNLKTPTEIGVENGYRITKVSSDLTITIDAKLLSEAEETDNSFSIISENDSNTYVLNGYTETGSFTYTYENNILTITTNDVLSLTLDGTYYGGIVINSEYDIDLILNNVEINSSDSCPLYINTTGNTSIKAESSTTNTIRDNRELVDENSTDVSSAIYVVGDLELKGTGEIYVYSSNNNGIHSKDDLTAKKLTLTINVCGNALKGNDSITIESGNYTLIARQGDGLKTSNSSLSSSGVQKGTITINDGVLNIYAACDGIDAAYDVIINNNPTINIYTDKYSTYSEEVTYTTENIYYIRSTSNSYKYSVYYYNSSTNEYV